MVQAVGSTTTRRYGWLKTDSFRSLFLWDYDRAAGQPAEAPVSSPPLVYDRAIQPNILNAVQSAQTSIDMEAFDLSDRDVVTALATAAQRGVAVEILLDPTQRYSAKAAETLRSDGATVRYYRPYGEELMHAKIIDVDHGKIFIIGSANFSHQAYTYNHEADLELSNVPAFDKSLVDDLSTQIARGTDTPIISRSHSTDDNG